MINNTPAIFCNSPNGAIAPNKPKEAPKAMKTREKPPTKLRVCRIMCPLPGGSEVRTDAPAILAIYTGTNGNMQGDRNDNSPATKATGKVTSSTRAYLQIYLLFPPVSPC
jgi:hypothetical protein